MILMFMISLENTEIITKKNVDDMIKKYKDYYKNKKVKSDNISKLLTDFRGYYSEQKFNLKKT